MSLIINELTEYPVGIDKSYKINSPRKQNQNQIQGSHYDEAVTNGESHPEQTSTEEKEKKSKLLMSLEYLEKGLKIEHVLKELNARSSSTENFSDKEPKSAEVSKKQKGLLVSFDNISTRKDEKASDKDKKFADKIANDKKSVKDEYKSSDKRSVKIESKSLEKRLVKDDSKSVVKKQERPAENTGENKKNPANKKGLVSNDCKENDKNLKQPSKTERPAEKEVITKVLKKFESSGSLDTLFASAKGKQKKSTNENEKINSPKKGKASFTVSGKIIKSPKSSTRRMSSNSEKPNTNADTKKKKLKKSASFNQASLKNPKNKKRTEPEVKKPEESPPKTREEILREKQKKYNLTVARPFSFEVRDKAYLTKKELLAKMGEERTYEIKRWARSPKILKKKPFSVTTTKRYIIPDLYNLKFRTEERIKKRPKFEDIVDQKQKTTKEQKLLQEMLEVRMLRKQLLHKPTPIPDYVMRLIQDTKSTYGNHSEASESDDDGLIPDIGNTDLWEQYFAHDSNTSNGRSQNHKHKQNNKILHDKPFILDFEFESDTVDKTEPETTEQVQETFYESSDGNGVSENEKTGTADTDTDTSKDLDEIKEDTNPNEKESFFDDNSNSKQISIEKEIENKKNTVPETLNNKEPGDTENIETKISTGLLQSSDTLTKLTPYNLLMSALKKYTS